MVSDHFSLVDGPFWNFVELNSFRMFQKIIGVDWNILQLKHGAHSMSSFSSQVSVLSRLKAVRDMYPMYPSHAQLR